MRLARDILTDIAELAMIACFLGSILCAAFALQQPDPRERIARVPMHAAQFKTGGMPK